MRQPPRGGEFPPERLRSPVWGDALERVESAIAGVGPRSYEARGIGVEAALNVLDRADAALLAVHARQTVAGSDELSDLIGSAAELLEAVAAVWAHYKPDGNRRAALTRFLAQRLSSHERSVLQGEFTYAVSVQEIREPIARLRKLVACFFAEKVFSHGDLVSLQEAAVELASLQVRAAGNIAISGLPGEAPESQSPEVNQLLRGISKEVVDATEEGLQRSPTGHDVVALHLGTGMRSLVSRPTLQGFESRSSDPASLATSLRGAREAWIGLARLEHVAISALDRDLQKPAYEERFEDLTAAIVDGAANLLYGGRMVSRPEAFRHDTAWHSQMISLSYGLEAYIRGLREIPDGFAQAQLIILARLVRAVAAVAAIDLRKPMSSSNGGRKLQLK